jgi:hypothetical protein
VLAPSEMRRAQALDVAISTSYLIPAKRSGVEHVTDVANGPNPRRTATKRIHHSMPARNTCCNKGQLIFVGEISVELVALEKIKPTFRTPCTKMKF